MVRLVHLQVYDDDDDGDDDDDDNDDDEKEEEDEKDGSPTLASISCLFHFNH